ncbi:hypothetical protein BC834DRAFT_847576 [Gloeopeniophorella convolvens]|nr:hypothetical protein BC834DRAFT_847576 [Gloeopeniophorella convolvens]
MAGGACGACRAASWLISGKKARCWVAQWGEGAMKEGRKLKHQREWAWTLAGGERRQWTWGTGRHEVGVLAGTGPGRHMQWQGPGGIIVARLERHMWQGHSGWCRKGCCYIWN